MAIVYPFSEMCVHFSYDLRSTHNEYDTATQKENKLTFLVLNMYVHYK